MKFYQEFLKRFYLFIFRERKERRMRGRETSMWESSHVSPTGDLAHNPGMCPDQKSNRQPLGSKTWHLVNWATPTNCFLGINVSTITPLSVECNFNFVAFYSVVSIFMCCYCQPQNTWTLPEDRNYSLYLYLYSLGLVVCLAHVKFRIKI